MESTNYNSDSEKELDQLELEVALYSQIHFDTGNDIETWCDSKNSHYQRVSLPFKIGVKELPTRIRSNVKKPVFDGEFIAFSSSNCEEGKNLGPHGAISDQEKFESAVVKPAVESKKRRSKDGDMHKLEDVIPQSNDRLSSAVSPKNKMAYLSCSSDSKPKKRNIEKLEIKAAVPDHVKKTKERNLSSTHGGHADVIGIQGDKSKKLVNEENVRSTTKAKKKLKADDKEVKQTELLLPFSLTKAPLKPKVTQTENVLTDKDTVNTKAEPVEKKNVSKQIKNNLAKLESFLELSKSEVNCSVVKRKKKASLSKTDAAVKPRAPKFFIRRPPAVVVKYLQDSDTNTDYSESDTSLSPSPVKTRQRALIDSYSSHDRLASKDKNAGNKSVTDAVRSERKALAGHKEAISHDEVVSDDEESVTDAVRSERKALAGHKEAISHDEVVSDDEESVTSCSSDESLNSEEHDEEDSDTDEEVEDEKSYAHEEVEDADDTDEEVEDAESDSDEEMEEEGSDSDELEDSSSNQEESTSDSEDTDSDDPAEFITETIPGLEFNLDSGVDGFASRKTDADIWKIGEKDRHNVTSTVSRYFIPRVIQCRNCKGNGHMSRDCPKPMMRRCIFCAHEGHSYQACPNAVCFKCNTPGHRFSECRERKQNWDIACGRCWMPGHEEEKCPDRWRQYHITIELKGSKLVTAKKDVKNPLVFCYNCGKKGHLGFECRLPRMNKFLVPNYPFIARYDTKNKQKEMKGKVGEGTTKAGCNHGDRRSEKQHNSMKKSKGFDRNKQRSPSNAQEKRQRREHEEERIGTEDASVYHRKNFRRENEKEHDRGGKKRRRRSNQNMESEHKINFQSGGKNNDKNIPRGQGYKGAMLGRDQMSNYMGHKRKFDRGEVTDDDILNDFKSHQVNVNEWWRADGSPAEKRKKRNTDRFSSDGMGADWRRDGQGQKQLLPDRDTKAVQGNRPHSFEDKAHKVGGQWRKTIQQQRVQGNHGHNALTLELGFKHNLDHHYRNNEHMRHGERQAGDFSNYMQNRGRRSPFGNKNPRQSQLHHAASWPVFQKADSNFSFNKSGFQARNDRFVAMKRNCNMRISIRK